MRANDIPEFFAELERGVHTALETYANVHRGSGHNSVASTRLYEQAGDIVLEYLGLARDKYVVVFCTPRRAELLKAQLASGSYRSVSSQEIGLPLGLRALAVDRKALPAGAPFQTGHAPFVMHPALHDGSRREVGGPRRADNGRPWFARKQRE